MNSEPKPKRYRIFRVNDKTGAEVEMTSRPLSHDDALIMLHKLSWTDYPCLRDVLREVAQ